MIKILFDHGNETNTKNNYGQTPLMFFSRYDNNTYNYVRIVENVLETMKPDLNIEDDLEKTPFTVSSNKSVK